MFSGANVDVQSTSYKSPSRDWQQGKQQSLATTVRFRPRPLFFEVRKQGTMTKVAQDILSTVKRLGPKVRMVDIQISVSGTKHALFQMVHVLNSDLKLIQADGTEPGGRGFRKRGSMQ